MSRRDDHPPPQDRKGAVTRRTLFKSAGIAAAAGALLRPVRALAEEETETVPGIGPGPAPVTLSVNGQKRKLTIEPRRTLLEALRSDLDLTGAKQVCDRGTCGACTVWLDGTPVYACSILAVEAEGREVTTVEGLGTPEDPHPVQAAFVKHDALQCGFCTPGFVMATAAAVRDYGTKLTRARLLNMVSGNLCRCGTYPNVVTAGLEAAGAAEER